MTETAGLRLHLHRVGSHATVVEVVGEVDMSSTTGLRQELLDAVGQGTVVLDCESVTFCDSTGLRALLEARQSAQDRGSAFRLAACSPALSRVLELSGVVDVFDSFPSVDAALDD